MCIRDRFMKNFESMLSGPQGLGEFLKKMGVDIHIKPSVSEVRVDVDESHSSDEDNSISSDDVYIKENKMYVTIDVSRYEDIYVLVSGNIDSDVHLVFLDVYIIGGN